MNIYEKVTSLLIEAHAFAEGNYNTTWRIFFNQKSIYKDLLDGLNEGPTPMSPEEVNKELVKYYNLFSTAAMTAEIMNLPKLQLSLNMWALRLAIHRNTLLTSGIPLAESKNV